MAIRQIASSRVRLNLGIGPLSFKDGAVNSTGGTGRDLSRLSPCKLLDCSKLCFGRAGVAKLPHRERRCCGTTATKAGLPQPARCQGAWHFSIQTVARFHRLEQPSLDPANPKVMCRTLLLVLCESARVLQLSGKTRIICFPSLWLKTHGKSRQGSFRASRPHR
jgi:hypothetical protein